MKRPSQQPARKPLSPAERKALAARVEYLGSKEHKAKRWWGGLPGIRYGRDGRPAREKREKTTICDLVSEQDRERATAWLRAAIECGQFGFLEGDQDFPKHVWYQAECRGWFGFCINRTAGHYKGWPMEEDERRAFFD
jgi:hypothetical protein